MVEAMFCNIFGLFVARFAVNRDLNGSRQLFQLFQSPRSVSVGADDAHSQSPFLEEACEFHGAGRLSGALNTDEHELPEYSRLDLDFRRVLADKLCHFLIEDFYYMISSGDPWWKLLLQRTILDRLGQLKNKLDVHVGLQ